MACQQKPGRHWLKLARMLQKRRTIHTRHSHVGYDHSNVCVFV
jgi:hypothetical protein